MSALLIDAMNLKSLANALGVSKTTVSRALNGYPEVNARTRERVLAAARECGYVPNPMARSLAVGRTNVFGIIYPLLPSDLGDPMFLSVVGGMSAALEKDGKNLIIAPVSPHNELPSYEQMVCAPGRRPGRGPHPRARRAHRLPGETGFSLCGPWTHRGQAAVCMV
ncbi:LacI family transcriptional regulator [Massilia sp. B-10]|nr:LacI family transcriptional regulator [Massilia sp. B-10]